MQRYICPTSVRSFVVRFVKPKDCWRCPAFEKCKEGGSEQPFPCQSLGGRISEGVGWDLPVFGLEPGCLVGQVDLWLY